MAEEKYVPRLKQQYFETVRDQLQKQFGYKNVNQIPKIEKIVVNDPDAIQAKVLMVRAINLIERRLLNTYYVFGEGGRYPSWSPDETEDKAFFRQALKVSDAQCGKASDKNFWNLTSSYLHFLNHDFELSSSYLDKVKSDDDLYMTMVRNLTAYIDICRQPTINADAERSIFAKYADLIKGNETYSFNRDYPSFVNLVLANRYELQGERAKSFLALNPLTEIENVPDEALVDDLERFLNKKKKTPLEEHIADVRTTGMTNPNNYLAYVKGVLRLTDGDFKEAKKLFAKQTRLTVSKRIFGHNIHVWFSGDEKEIMHDDYISEFSFIHDNMTELEVTDALMQLQKIGEKKGDEAAKANYLISNFFYNVSRTGYFRQYLRFDNNNGFCYDKFATDVAYKNTVGLSESYLEKAKKTAVDHELKAHIVFAHAKNVQQMMEEDVSYWNYSKKIPLEEFNEFDQYYGTQYHNVVLSNCLYYNNYYN